MMRMICLRPQPPAPATHRQAPTPPRDDHSTCSGSWHGSYLRSHRSSRTARPRGSSPSATSAPPCQTAPAAEVRHISDNWQRAHKHALHIHRLIQAPSNAHPSSIRSWQGLTVAMVLMAAAMAGLHTTAAPCSHTAPQRPDSKHAHTIVSLRPPLLSRPVSASAACLPASLTDDGADEREPLHGAHEEGRVVVARAGARQTGQEHQAREEDALLAATTTSTPEAGSGVLLRATSVEAAAYLWKRCLES